MNLYWWSFTISQYSSILNETLKALDDFKNKQKNVRGDVFWYVKVHIFRKCILYVIDWDLNTIVKKISSDKINGTKNALFSFVDSKLSKFYFWFVIFKWAKAQGLSL